MCKVYNCNRWCALTKVLWFFCRNFRWGWGSCWIESWKWLTRSRGGVTAADGDKYFTKFSQFDAWCKQQHTMAKAVLAHQLCCFWIFDHRYSNAKREYRAIVLAWIALVGFVSLNDVDLISYQCSKFYAQMFASFFLIYYMLTITEYLNASGATKLMGGWSERRSEGAVLLSSFLR